MYLDLISSRFPGNNSRQLDHYYSVFYLHFCQQSEFGIFATWQFLVLTSHCISFFAIPIHVFCAFCILYKTPIQMKESKSVMLNLHFWRTCTDITYSILIIPYFFYPAMSVSAYGFLTIIGISHDFQIILLGIMWNGMSISMVIMAEHRHHLLVDASHRLSNMKRFTIFALQYFLGSNMFTFSVLSKPEQEMANIRNLQQIPCPTNEFFIFPPFNINSDLLYILPFTVGFGCFYFTQIMFYNLHSFYVLMRNRNYSNRTRYLKKQYLIRICVQISVSILILLGPVAYSFYSIFSGIYHQGLNNLATLWFCLHGIVATTTQLLVCDPYRQYCISLLCKAKLKFKNNRINAEPETHVDLPTSINNHQ